MVTWNSVHKGYDEGAFRVRVGPDRNDLAQGDHTVFYQGPYAKRGTAKGQVTALRSNAKYRRGFDIDYNAGLAPGVVARYIETDQDIEDRIYLEWIPGPWQRA